MSPILKNLIGIILGIIFGSIINGLIINLGHKIVPVPAGVDLTTAEGFKAGIDQLNASHYIFPFLAHAIGTFAGAVLASRIGSNSKYAALVVGFVFLLGGIVMCFMIPAPWWFMLIDVVLAYIPMAWLAYVLFKKG